MEKLIEDLNKVVYGFKVHQERYARNLKPIDLPRGNNATFIMTQLEMNYLLREAVGSLLFLCYTRADLVSATCELQMRANDAEIEDLRRANSTIRCAKLHSMRGLYYHWLPAPTKLLAIADSSFTTSSTTYAIEGAFVLCIADRATDIASDK